MFGNQFYPQYGQPMQYPQGYAAPNNGAMPDQLAQWRGAAQQPQMPQMPTGGWQNTFAWVQGEAGAKSFLVAPGVRAFLMDTEADVFYIKTADASGIPMPLRYFDYTERTNDAYAAAAQPTVQPIPQPTPQIDLSGYITREEFEAFREAVSTQAPTTTAKKSTKVTEGEEIG